MALSKQQLIAMVEAAVAAKAVKIAALNTITTTQPDIIELPAEVAAMEPDEQQDFVVAALSNHEAVEPVPVESTLPAPAEPAAPAFTLTTEQQAAVNYVKAGDSVVLCGFAGTGKTTTMKFCMQELIAAGIVPNLSAGTKYLASGAPGVVVVSFTNKAVKNIQRLMPDNIKAHTLTIHKLLQFKPEFFEVEDLATGAIKKSMRFVPTYTALNPLPENLRCVAHEESSMENIALYAMLRAAMPHKHQEIFLGDLNQLPPVFGSAILGFKMLELPVVQLTIPQRQAAASSILRFSWTIKDGLDSLYSSTDNRVVEFDGGVKRKLYNWAVKLGSENDENGKITIKPFQKKLLAEHAMLTCVTMLKQWSLPTHTDDLTRYNPEKDIILTPFNKSFGTLEMNKQIMQFLGERRGAAVHEIIAGYNKHYLAVGDRLMYDKQDCVITAIAHNPDYLGKMPQLASRNLDRWGYFREIEEAASTYHGEASTQSDEDAFDLMTASSSDIEDRVNAASHVLTIELESGEVFDLEASAQINALLGGYAITVHKSQGSEWEKVFLFLHHTQATMLSRELLYTAVTRARKELFMICEPDSIEKCCRNARLLGTTIEEKAEQFKGKLDELEQHLINQGAV